MPQEVDGDLQVPWVAGAAPPPEPFVQRPDFRKKSEIVRRFAQIRADEEKEGTFGGGCLRFQSAQSANFCRKSTLKTVVKRVRRGAVPKPCIDAKCLTQPSISPCLLVTFVYTHVLNRPRAMPVRGPLIYSQNSTGIWTDTLGLVLLVKTIRSHLI